jgi:hypothetical protein
MDSSRFRGGAGRYARSRFTIENYPRWIPMAELDSTSLGKKRIFAVVSRPIGVGPKGKAIKRIVIFDNHPESLRLLLESGLDSDNDDATARWERRGSIICGSILIAIVLAALLWVLG